MHFFVSIGQEVDTDGELGAVGAKHLFWSTGYASRHDFDDVHLLGVFGGNLLVDHRIIAHKSRHRHSHVGAFWFPVKCCDAWQSIDTLPLKGTKGRRLVNTHYGYPVSRPHRRMSATLWEFYKCHRP